MPFRNILEGTPVPPPHAALVEMMLDRTDLLTRMGELDEAGGFLIDARRRAFRTKCACAEADRQIKLAEAEIVLDGLSGSNERERKADLDAALPKHPAYAQWLRCQQDAAEAQVEAEAAETRYKTARDLLRAAAAAVGALGGGS